jgi:hypothetical protein
MVRDRMSCRCVQEQWLRDLGKQRELAKKTAVLLDCPQVLFRKPDGTFHFVSEGQDYNGEFYEIITQY